MLLHHLGLQRHPRRGNMRSTAATTALHLQLIGMAQRGDRPRCCDPVDRELWVSDDYRDRQIAVAWCAGCPILEACRQAADANDERWHVWGGRDYTRRPRGQQAA